MTCIQILTQPSYHLNFMNTFSNWKGFCRISSKISLLETLVFNQMEFSFLLAIFSVHSRHVLFVLYYQIAHAFQCYIG